MAPVRLGVYKNGKHIGLAYYNLPSDWETMLYRFPHGVSFSTGPAPPEVRAEAAARREAIRRGLTSAEQTDGEVESKRTRDVSPTRA